MAITPTSPTNFSEKVPFIVCAVGVVCIVGPVIAGLGLLLAHGVGNVSFSATTVTGLAWSGGALMFSGGALCFGSGIALSYQQTKKTKSPETVEEGQS